MKIKKVHSYSIESCKDCKFVLTSATIAGQIYGCKILKTMVIPDQLPENCPLPDFICEIAEFSEIICEK